MVGDGCAAHRNLPSAATMREPRRDPPHGRPGGRARGRFRRSSSTRGLGRPRSPRGIWCSWPGITAALAAAGNAASPERPQDLPKVSRSSHFRNSKIIHAFAGFEHRAHPARLPSATGPRLVRRFWISKLWIDLWIGSNLMGGIGDIRERAQFIEPLFKLQFLGPHLCRQDRGNLLTKSPKLIYRHGF
jgi:hypothetical protein